MRIGPNGIDARGEHGDMVSHALATIAYCSLLHVTRNREFEAPSQAMVEFIEHAQDSETGGWGLQPGTKGDAVVTGWQILALEAARCADLRVSDKTLRKTAEFLDRVQSENGAYYGRTESGRDPTATAMGLLSRLYLGWKPEQEEVRRGTDYLEESGPTTRDVQFTFVATLLMRRCDGEAWHRWNAAQRELLVEAQEREAPETGSWFQSDEINAARGGRLYQTLFSAMTLSVYYRFRALVCASGET